MSDIHALITDLETGAVLERLGPFEHAQQARSAVAQHTGLLLAWERAGEVWVAQAEGRVYTVPREATEGDTNSATNNLN